MNYDADVLKDAVDFLDNHSDEFKDAISNGLDFDLNDIDGLDEWFHEEITDRSYSLTDASYILENCDNEETDSGLWEGKSPTEAIPIMAAYSYANDVWFKCEELYNEIKDSYKEILAEPESEDMEPPTEEYAIERAWGDFRKEYIEIKPIEKGSEEEQRLIKRWLDLNPKAGLWGGYPVGNSYIDARCGSGHGMPEVKDYVDIDQEIAQKCPHLRGKNRHEMEKYYKKISITQKKRGGLK